MPPVSLLTLGAFTYRTQRSAPASGDVKLAADPVAGYPNVLRISTTDRFGGDRDSFLDDLETGDVIRVDTGGGGLFPLLVTGSPSSSPTELDVPVDIARDFGTTDEPSEGQELTLFRRASVAWPTTDELAQVVNVENVDDWQTTLDRVMSAAIAATKGVIGSWDDTVDAPTDNEAAAALRMGELMSQRPDASVKSLIADASFRAYLTGRRRRFGIA